MDDDKVLEREWFGTLPDAEKAAVVKVLISEREQTQRARIEADTQQHETRQKSEGYHVIRGLSLLVAVFFIVTSGIVTCHRIDLAGIAPATAPSSPLPQGTQPAASSGSSAVPPVPAPAKETNDAGR